MVKRPLSPIADRIEWPRLLHSAGRILAAAAALLVAGGGMAPAAASCQTTFCQYRYALEAVEGVELLRQAVEQDPRQVHELIRRLGHRADNVREIARWRESFHFEQQPVLADGQLDTRIQAEIEHWSTFARRLGPEPGSQACRLAGPLAGQPAQPPDDDEAELQALRRHALADPESAAAARCLQRALASVGREAEAMELAEAFIAAQPENAAGWQNALALDEDGGVGSVHRRLLERRAEQLPSFENRLDLLRSYVRAGEVPARDRLAAELEAEASLPREALSLCAALRRARDDAAEACRLRLYERLFDAPWEVWAGLRTAMLDALVGDWDRIDAFLAGWPPDELVSGWGRLVDLDQAGACPRLIDSAAGLIGALQPEQSPAYRVEELSRLFETCGRADLAAAAYAPHLPAPPSTPEAARQAWKVAKARRILDDPEASAAHLPWLSSPSSGLPEHVRREAAVRWVEAMPGDLGALRVLLDLHQDPEEATTLLRDAARRRPDDLDIPLTLGAAALDWGEHEIVLGAADAVDRHPEASPRQRAEAAYLRGRVARREGRWEEASELLVAYFSQRQRYAACGYCDGGLIAHLVETGDVELLDDYLERRRQNLAAYHRLHLDGRPVRPDPRVEWLSSERSVAAQTRPYLERLAVTDPETAAKRLEALAGAELFQPGSAEDRFSDRTIFALAPSLLEVR